MATIGTFTASENGYSGSIKTLLRAWPTTWLDPELQKHSMRGDRGNLSDRRSR